MNIARHTILFPALACLLALAGCFGAKTIVPTQYYILDPPLDITARQHAGPSVGVRPLLSALPIERRMAFREEGSKVGYRETEWADRPVDALTRALLDGLAAGGAFADTGLASDMSRPELILSGELRRFYENRTVAPPTAEIEARLELRKARDNGAVWAQTLHVEKPVADDSPAALTEAMNQAMGELISSAVNAMGGRAGD